MLCGISKKRLFAFAAFWLACSWPVTAASAQTAGDVTAVLLNSNRVDFSLSGGGVARVEFIESDILRVRWNPSGSFTTQVSGAISLSGLNPVQAFIYDGPDQTYLLTDSMYVFVFKHPFYLLVVRPDGTIISYDVADGIQRTSDGTILNQKHVLPSEHYAGFGLRGGPVDRHGRTFFMHNVDWGNYTEFTDPLYSSTPFYYGMRNGSAYGLFFDNPAGSFFDMDSTGSGIVTIGAMDGELDYYLLAGPKPSDVSLAFAKLTGFSPLPPLWTLGYHQSRYGYKSQQEFLDLASNFRQLQIPCDALFFDLFYLNNLQPFTWDPLNFPDPAGMNQSLGNQGFHTVNIIDPVVLSTDPQWGGLASSNSFLVSSDGTPLVNNIFYGDVSWLDFTRSTVKSWYKLALKSFLSLGGTSAVWNDLNEPAQNFMPQAIYNFDGQGRTDTQARNLYALNEVATSWQAQRELQPNVRPWVLSRSGYPGIQRYAANWSGDTASSFDSLRVSIQISISMGLSDQNQFGHDVGGFLGAPTAELFIRWLEFGSLIPYFRNHSMYTNPPREPWAFGEPYTSMARSIIEQRYRLLPYLYSLTEAASRTATPVLSPLFFNFPGDDASFSQDTEYMLGPDMLVAPVYVEGATSRSVYLPSGANWIDKYTDSVYTGGISITTDAQLDTIPVFLRSGAIIPIGPVLQYSGQTLANAEEETVDVYLPSSEEFIMYEDDGVSTGYTSGAFLRTSLKNELSAGQNIFTIERTEGSWVPPARNWTLQFHSLGASPAGVQLNNIALQPASSEAALATMAAGWFYRASSGVLLVRLADSDQLLSISFE